MSTIAGLSFAAPLALLGLALLPVIWWLLRLTPPSPERIVFPPIRLLLRLRGKEQSAAKTPPWLLLLRLLTAALLVLAAAQPLLNRPTGWNGSGPLLLVIDDGWAAARHWDQRRALLVSLVEQAVRDGRPVALLPTAPLPEDEAGPLQVTSARQALEAASGLQPHPWEVDRSAALARVAASALPRDRGAQVIWLSDGLDHGHVDAFAKGLVRFGPLTLVAGDGVASAKLLRPPVVEGGAIVVTAERVAQGPEETFMVRAFTDDGRLAAREELTFLAGDRRGEMRLELPAELANRVDRIDLEDAGGREAAGSVASAASVILLDERWRRRPVGLVASEGAPDLPLLSSLYYLNRALEPFTEVRQGPILDLLKRELAVMVLPDPGRLATAESEAVKKWINDGGVAVRFAGALLARSSGGRLLGGDPPLLPVKLRRGDRVIGGAMSWTQPARLAPFDLSSPFHGLAVPKDVVVNRQVLAEPSLDLADKTWARLSDGTPLVTAERRGKGYLVLFHTTANTQWSNLALSGLFVEMLERLVGLSQGVLENGTGPPLEPLASLDAFGRLGDARLDAKAIDDDRFADTVVSADHPPGIYGRTGMRRALNLGRDVVLPTPLGGLPVAANRAGYEASPVTDLRPWLLCLAALLVLADLAASLILRGMLPLPRPAAGLVLAALLAGASPPALAAADDAEALADTTNLRLAYVITGNPEVDRVSRLGLGGLSLVVRRRTAAELAEPRAVDPAKDELAFYPLLYWPVVPGAATLGEAARVNVNTYLRNGGSILFDTRDESGGADIGELRALARQLDIPPLVSVPPDHVLTRAFYLLQDFPGRWAGRTLWVERAGERVNDGVSPVIAGGNDWAAAWALDEVSQAPLYPVVPGGERQREMAYRFGINLVMYVLTGNYKSDQVHLPAILQRLGQ